MLFVAFSFNSRLLFNSPELVLLWGELELCCEDCERKLRRMHAIWTAGDTP